MKARGNELLLVRSAAAKLDQQRSERGRNSSLINDSAEEAMENHREALDIAFTTLKHAKWQIGGNMLRRVWAGLWFAFVFFIGAHANAVPVVIYSNFGPGDSVKNSVDDVLNQQSYGEHAARFFVPTGTNFTFTGIDVPIQDALAENERIESQLSIRLWTDDAAQPGTLLESMATDVIQLPPGYLIQHVDSTSNTTLLQNNYYWISLAAVNPGRVAWFVNNTETGGYALKWPTSGAAWLVIDTAAAGAFRVFGEAALVPEPTTLCLGTMAVIGMLWRGRRRGVSPVRI
jgi:PEP-CTERM motif